MTGRKRAGNGCGLSIVDVVSVAHKRCVRNTWSILQWLNRWVKSFRVSKRLPSFLVSVLQCTETRWNHDARNRPESDGGNDCEPWPPLPRGSIGMGRERKFLRGENLAGLEGTRGENGSPARGGAGGKRVVCAGAATIGWRRGFSGTSSSRESGRTRPGRILQRRGAGAVAAAQGRQGQHGRVHRTIDRG